jgi:hypothetical protein
VIGCDRLCNCPQKLQYLRQFKHNCIKLQSDCRGNSGPEIRTEATMTRAFTHFIHADDGGITVDWVILAAGLVGVGIATTAVVSSGVESGASDIDRTLSTKIIRTTFSYLPDTFDFANGIEGWIVTGAGRQSEIRHSDAAGSDGKPGFLVFKDATGGYSWVDMPTPFKGDQSGKYGGTVSYDLTLLSQNGTMTSGQPTLRLTGANGKTIAYSDPTEPTTGSWTSYSADMSQGGWKIGNRTATRSEIEAVLADVSHSELRVEYINGGEEIGLDNMQFNPA